MGILALTPTWNPPTGSRHVRSDRASISGVIGSCPCRSNGCGHYGRGFSSQPQAAPAAGATRFPECGAFLPNSAQPQTSITTRSTLRLSNQRSNCSGDTRSLDESPAGISQRELKDLVCQINCRGSSIQFRTPPSRRAPAHHRLRARHDDAA